MLQTSSFFKFLSSADKLPLLSCREVPKLLLSVFVDIFLGSRKFAEMVAQSWPTTPYSGPTIPSSKALCQLQRPGASPPSSFRGVQQAAGAGPPRNCCWQGCVVAFFCVQLSDVFIIALWFLALASLARLKKRCPSQEQCLSGPHAVCGHLGRDCLAPSVTRVAHITEPQGTAPPPRRTGSPHESEQRGQPQAPWGGKVDSAPRGRRPRP